jgi:hypothetical protein
MFDRKQWVALIKKFEDSRGHKLLVKWRGLELSQYIFEKNFEELINCINLYERDDSIWSIENRSKLENIQKEFLRLTHNYLSSVHSLLGHTYSFRDNLNNSTFTEFYKKESERFKVDETTNLIQDLRHYIQHYKLPFSKASFSFEMINTETREGISKKELLLDRKELLNWKNWTPLSKKYLSNQENDINLKEIVLGYKYKITKFYKDLHEEFLFLYKKEITESEEIKKEISLLQLSSS